MKHALGWMRGVVLVTWATAALAAPVPSPWLDRVAATGPEPYRVDAKGPITSASHPKHPGDFGTYEGAWRIFHDPRSEQAVFEFETGEEGAKDVDRYFARAGRIFQVDEKGAEIGPEPFGDLSAATIAALDPTVVVEAIADRRENVRFTHSREAWFAWNDELWHVGMDPAKHRIEWIERSVHHDVLGDGTERIRFEEWGKHDPALPGRIVVTLRGRETARLEVAAVTRGVKVECARGDRERDRSRWLVPDEIRFTEFAPGLFHADLADQNTRVFVAEFADYLVVLEGAYTSRIGDRIAAHVRERFHKPVRYFAFSHMHGQYIGSTRSWIHEGATILVPPSTAPLIEEMARQHHELRPDALLRDPKPARVETVKDSRRIEDVGNAMVIYNVESGHTDEYFIVYFPRQKVLTTGDLMFYRPGKPISDRTQLLCKNVRKLGLDVEKFYATWPLEGYGTESITTKEEMQAACGE